MFYAAVNKLEFTSQLENMPDSSCLNPIKLDEKQKDKNTQPVQNTYILFGVFFLLNTPPKLKIANMSLVPSVITSTPTTDSC